MQSTFQRYVMGALYRKRTKYQLLNLSWSMYLYYHMNVVCCNFFHYVLHSCQETCIYVDEQTHKIDLLPWECRYL